MNRTTLGKVCDIKMGRDPRIDKAGEAGGGVPVISSDADFGDRYPITRTYTTESTLLTAPDDILFSPRGDVGKVNWSDREYRIGYYVARLRPQEGLLDGGFLWHWLNFARKQIRLKAAGKGHVTVRDLIKLPILMPEKMQEQKRVAEILDKADDIRSKRRQAIMVSEALQRSWFLDAFGDPALNPRQCPKQSLEELCDISMKPRVPDGTYLTPRLRNESRHIRVAEPRVTYHAPAPTGIERVPENSTVSEQQPGLSPGDVVLPCEPLGEAVIVPEDHSGTVSTRMIAATPKDGLISPTYLRDALNSAGGRHLMMQKVKNRRFIRLDARSFKEVSIPVPSISEQESYSKQAEQLVQAREQLVVAYQGSEAVYAALSQDLLNGSVEKTP